MDSAKLQAVVAKAGYCSRRKAEVLIADGRIKVNGRTATIGQRVTPNDKIKIGGKPLQFDQTRIVILVDKPAGYVSTTSDELGRRTVLDLLPKELRRHRLYPVGRLDRDSEGLVILTNDGNATLGLSHPSFQVPKTYRIQIDRKPTDRAIDHLRKGVLLKDGWAKPVSLEILPDDDDNDRQEYWLELTITEGRNHQIKRMLKRVGYFVTRLIRISHGPYHLDQLNGHSFTLAT